MLTLSDTTVRAENGTTTRSVHVVNSVFARITGSDIEAQSNGGVVHAATVEDTEFEMRHPIATGGHQARLTTCAWSTSGEATGQVDVAGEPIGEHEPEAMPAEVFDGSDLMRGAHGDGSILCSGS